MSQSFAMLLKSYAEDFNYAQRMVESFNRFNLDKITMYAVVPTPDLELFAPLKSDTVTLIAEEEFSRHLVDSPVHGMRAGYINQEIVKLAFWELGRADNYFCVDSDAEFIRDFRVQDFMYDEHTPYSVLVEDHELEVEPAYFKQYWQSREAEIRHIADIIGWTSPVIRTCHGHAVLSAKVLQSFVDDFLVPREWDYKDALAEAPYEFSWYNIWMQFATPIDIHQREPWIKVFHHEGHHLEYLMRGITTQDIARGYLGIVVNSNYSRDLGVMNASASKPESLARYLSYGELAGVLAAKIKDTTRRRLGRGQN
ncbi:MAG: DUF6492 family protein [Actinomycetota bacterium]|nr:DUF6492 family protein [Actinomycetota bacterium]